MIVDSGLIAVLKVLLRESILNGKIGLYTGAPTIDASTVLGDLTEATFTGYAKKLTRSLTWPDPTINVNGEAETDGPTVHFVSTADTSPSESITGIFVTIEDETSAETLLLAADFDAPTVIALAGDAVDKKLNFFADQY